MKKIYIFVKAKESKQLETILKEKFKKEKLIISGVYKSKEVDEKKETEKDDDISSFSKIEVFKKSYDDIVGGEKVIERVLRGYIIELEDSKKYTEIFLTLNVEKSSEPLLFLEKIKKHK